MPNQERQSLTKSFELVPGRDDDLISFILRPDVSISGAVREGLRLLIKRQTMEEDALDILGQLRDLLLNGATVAPAKQVKEAGYNDPFLDSSL